MSRGARALWFGIVCCQAPRHLPHVAARPSTPTRLAKTGTVAHVLIVSLVFTPDTVSTASLVGEMAEGLGARGHAVTVLTSMPHYNAGPDAQRCPTHRRVGRFRVWS